MAGLVVGMGLLVLVSVLGLVGGCVDAGAVGEFAGRAGAMAQTREVAELGPASVARSMEMVRSELAGAESARTEWLASLEEAKETAARTIALQGVVAGYMRTLGALADDELVGIDAELAVLSERTALGEGGAGIVRDERDGGSGESARALVGVVARAATDGYRRRELARVIAEADAPLQEVLGTLIVLAERGVLGLLEDERALGALKEADEERAAALAQRESLVRAYAASAREVADAHAMLAADAGRSGLRELSVWLRPHLERMEALRTEMEVARANLKKGGGR